MERKLGILGMAILAVGVLVPIYMRVYHRDGASTRWLTNAASKCVSEECARLVEEHHDRCYEHANPPARKYRGKYSDYRTCLTDVEGIEFAKKSANAAADGTAD